MKLIYVPDGYYIVCDSQEQCTEVKDKLIDEGIYSITDPNFERWTLKVDGKGKKYNILRILIGYDGTIHNCNKLREEEGDLVCIVIVEEKEKIG